MNDLLAQEFIEEIQHLKDQESYQKKEIERLRNDNSTKQEQIDRNRERLVALNTEIKERKENFEEIERKFGKDQVNFYSKIKIKRKIYREINPQKNHKTIR